MQLHVKDMYVGDVPASVVYDLIKRCIFINQIDVTGHELEHRLGRTGSYFTARTLLQRAADPYVWRTSGNVRKFSVSRCKFHSRMVYKPG